jgi:hypothetical protein
VSQRLSLVEVVQGLLERTYRMHTGLSDVGRFFVGDSGYRELYGQGEFHVAGAASNAGSKTLVRETSNGVRASVYLPDALVRRLERYPPQRGLCDENVDAFATLVEELDHLLLIAARARGQRPVSLFELELHANVSKHLVLSRFLAGRSPRLSEHRRLWLRHHLFEKARYCDEDLDTRDRYRQAARWAVKLIDTLPGLSATGRLGTLRRFHREDGGGKLRLIQRLENAA